MIFTRWGAKIWDERWRSTQMPPEDRGELGDEAKKLLDNPILHLALDRVEEKLTRTWQHTAPGEAQEREAAYAIYWAAQQFRSELRIMIANAGMAARERRE